MVDSNLQKQPHTFPDLLAAVTALAGFVGEWSSLLQFEVSAVFDGGERVFSGYQVRAKDMDGFGVGYICARAKPTEAPDATNAADLLPD